jgi:hypothetical protein
MNMIADFGLSRIALGSLGFLAIAAVVLTPQQALSQSKPSQGMNSPQTSSPAQGMNAPDSGSKASEAPPEKKEASRKHKSKRKYQSAGDSPAQTQPNAPSPSIYIGSGGGVGFSIGR